MLGLTSDDKGLESALAVNHIDCIYSGFCFVSFSMVLTMCSQLLASKEDWFQDFGTSHICQNLWVLKSLV